MKEKRLLCVLMKDNHIYNVVNDNIFKQDKNCYIVTKYGSMAHPFICYGKKVCGETVRENKIIGGYPEIIHFLKDKTHDRVYLRGFNRATIGRIFRLVLESKTNKVIKKEHVKVRTRKK